MTISYRVLFLSSNTQDFIEVSNCGTNSCAVGKFLSSNTQDFIEVENMAHSWTDMKKFLSSNTQDFIEVRSAGADLRKTTIPEL